jgi:hypothetical protein
MIDPVAICNIALGFIGANTITTLDEDAVSSTEEELCANLFEPLVKKMLEEKAWLFATGVISLGAEAYPEDEVERADLPRRFKIPADVVAVRAVDDGSGAYTIKWERAGMYVVTEQTDVDALFAIVTKFNNDPKTWSPTFSMALSYKIASILAVPLTHNAKLMGLYEEEYKKEIAKAGIYDGMQGSTNDVAKVRSSSLSGRR